MSGTMVATFFTSYQSMILAVAEPKLSLLEALNHATSLIFNRLLLVRSDLARGKESVDYAAGTDTMGLSNRFRGLAREPLVRLPTQYYLTRLVDDTPYLLHPTGAPREYRLIGSTLQLFPVPVSAVTLSIDCWSAPGNVTSMAGVIPYGGIFDQLYAELAVRILATGSAVVMDPALELFIDQALVRYQSLRSGPLRAERTTRSTFC